MNINDIDNVKEVPQHDNGTTSETRISFDFQYVERRVRRKVPPPDSLYNKILTFKTFFKDTDKKTNAVLFSEKTRKSSLIFWLLRRKAMPAIYLACQCMCQRPIKMEYL